MLTALPLAGGIPLELYGKELFGVQRFKKILLVSDEKKGGVALKRAVTLTKKNQAQEMKK